MVALVLATLAIPSASHAQSASSSCCGTSVYFRSFSGNPGDGWSTETRSSTPSGQAYLGFFGNNTVTFDSSLAPSFPDIPAHTELLISFDVYVFRSYDGDGNLRSCCGPEIFTVKEGAVNRTVYQTTFNNYDYGRTLGPSGVPGSVLLPGQSYPAQYPAPGGTPHWPGQGAAAINSLGAVFGPDANYPAGTPMDATYHVVIPIDHTATDLKISFSMSGQEGVVNEFWGLDNFCISVPDSDSFGSEFETQALGWNPGQPNVVFTQGAGSYTNLNRSQGGGVNRQESVYYVNPNNVNGNFRNGSFEASLRLSGGDCLTCPYGLWIRGTPQTAAPFRATGHWQRGYEFMISRDSTFSIVKARFPTAALDPIVDRQPIFRTNANGVSEPIVNPNDNAENILRVDFNETTVNFYVNGVLVYSTCDFDDQITTGKVGVLIERSADDEQPVFKVDYARVCSTSLACAPAAK
jgi:hypothetical protein